MILRPSSKKIPNYEPVYSPVNTVILDITGAFSSRPTSKDASTKGKILFSTDPDASSVRNDKVKGNATDGIKVVPSCFKGTKLHLKVLPGCCPTLPPLKSSDRHTVMFKVPIIDNICPQPDPEKYYDAWDCDHVQMPCSPANTYENGEDVDSRWELIKKSLSEEIKSSYDLEKAILNYNKEIASQLNFNGLHVFFKEILPEKETTKFFQSTLPAMIKLALNLPEICTKIPPWMPKTTGKWRKEMWGKLANPEPTGTVTFHRQSLQQFPKWSSSQKDVLHVAIDPSGVIEADGSGMLQVDFADPYVGGFVLVDGCVQEEIRFVICPELIVCRLFTECLGATEVLLMSGAEQYNKYKGYGSSLLWNGDYQDQTPSDSWGRRCTRIVAMDAQNFRYIPTDQFKVECVERELNKAYCGFYDSEVPSENLPAVATGNWGCGIFNGNPYLKFLIQLMAASEAGRDMIYFTFHSDGLQKKLENMYCLVVEKKLKVGDIWNLLVKFNSEMIEEVQKAERKKFYDFVCSSLSK